MIVQAFKGATGGAGGIGTVTSVSVVTANGISGTVATATTTPAITIIGALPTDGTGTGATAQAQTLTKGAIVSLFSAAQVTVVADYTMDSGTNPDYTVFVDATAGNVDVTLPDPTSFDGRIVNVKKIDATANRVRLLGNVGDGATQTTTQFVSWQLQSDANAWWII